MVATAPRLPALEIGIIDEPAIVPEIDLMIRRCLVTCFPGTKSFATSRFFNGYRPMYTVLGMAGSGSGSTLAAGLAVIDKTVVMGGKNYRVAAVGNVFVMPAFRGRGFSTGVLRFATDEAKRRGFDCGLLFPSAWRVYDKAGWKKLPGTQLMIFPLRDMKIQPGPVVLKGPPW